LRDKICFPNAGSPSYREASQRCTLNIVAFWISPALVRYSTLSFMLTLLLYIAHFQFNTLSVQYEPRSQAPHEPRFDMASASIARGLLCRNFNLGNYPNSISITFTLHAPSTSRLSLSAARTLRSISYCYLSDHMSLAIEAFRILLRGNLKVSPPKRNAERKLGSS
jgi:hypothetical protein